ncbi:MAG: hypothetical protein ABSE63_01610 [Thermoguttaceae bacterium]
MKNMSGFAGRISTACCKYATRPGERCCPPATPRFVDTARPSLLTAYAAIPCDLLFDPLSLLA